MIEFHEYYNYESRLLSPAEKNVAELIAKGFSNKEISKMLFVTEKTIKYHITNIHKKLKIKSRNKLIVFALTGYKFYINGALPIGSVGLK